MSEEQDYSSLPLEERAIHKEWKVRAEAYEEMAQLFSKTRNEEDPSFHKFGQPDLFRAIVTDSNVVAQEKGINCLCTILQFGGKRTALKLRNIVPALCEKSFVSSRAGTKQKATEALMLFIEFDTPEPIIEAILPFLSHKIPKVIAAATKALADIISAFGCITCSPKPIIPLMSKLFGHADKNVRAEATNLSIQIYRWIGPAFEDLVFADLKPVQQKDLKAAFDKVTEKPEQTRFLASQKISSDISQPVNDTDGDVDMVDDNTAEKASQFEGAIDVYDMADPVDVLSALPQDFYTNIGATKWLERKEALEALQAKLNVIKIEDNNFNELVRVLGKCIGKDANIQVATVALKCVEQLAKGLRADFNKYINLVLPSILERTKEKKQTVVDALTSCLDAIFVNASLSYVVEDVTKYLSHKTPAVKIATAQFLTRSLQTSPVAPKQQEYEMFLPPAVKLLSDSQEPVRSAGSDAIGTLMKIIGERQLAGYLDKVDAIRMEKIKDVYSNVVIVAKVQQTKPKTVTRTGTQRASLAPNTAHPPRASIATSRLSQISRPLLTPGSTGTRQSVLKKPAHNSLPAKRMATSPLKNEPKPVGSRLSNMGRSLQSNTLSSANSPPLVQDQLSSAERQELETLRQEKAKWAKEMEQFQWKIKDTVTREERLMKELTSLQFKNETLMEEHTKDVISIKSKDTQLARAHSDLENARARIQKLEQLQTSVPSSADFVTEKSSSPLRAKYISPFEDASVGADLSSKVKRLSIDNRDKENNSPQLDFGKSKIEIDLENNDDSWRRAAEVTSQLKARIEKMKARSRSNVSNFGTR